MRHCRFGMLGGDIRMIQIAVIDGLFELGGAGFEMLFLAAPRYDSAGKRMLKRGIGMLDQDLRVAGFAMFDGRLSMFESGCGVFFGKSSRANE
jgi:hypothetical protein